MISVVLWRKYFIKDQGYKMEQINYFNTTKVPPLWEIMGEPRAQGEKNT